MEVTTESNSKSIELSVRYPNSTNLSFNFLLTLTVYKQTLPSLTYQKQFQNLIVFPKTKILIQNLQCGKMYKIQLKCKSSGLKEQIIKNIFSFTKHAQQNLEASQNLEQEDQNQYQSISYSLGRQAKINIKNYFQQYRQQNLHKSQRNFQQQKQQNSYSYGNRSDFNENKLQQNTFKSLNQNNQYFNKESNFYLKQKQKTSFSNSQLMLKGIGQCSSFIKKNKVQKYLLEGRKCKNITEFVNQKGKKHNPQKERRQILQKKILVAKGIDVFNQVYNQDEGMKFFKNDWFMGPFYSYDENQKKIKKT